MAMVDFVSLRCHVESPLSLCAVTLATGTSRELSYIRFTDSDNSHRPPAAIAPRFACLNSVHLLAPAAGVIKGDDSLMSCVMSDIWMSAFKEC